MAYPDSERDPKPQTQGTSRIGSTLLVVGLVLSGLGLALMVLPGPGLLLLIPGVVILVLAVALRSSTSRSA